MIQFWEQIGSNFWQNIFALNLNLNKILTLFSKILTFNSIFKKLSKELFTTKSWMHWNSNENILTNNIITIII